MNINYENSRLNLIACLALYQHRQDMASGINWISSRTKGLLLYYNHLQEKQLIDTMQMHYLNSIIQDGYSKIKILKSKIKKSDKKQEILMEAQEIEKDIVIAKAMLDDIKEITVKK